MSATATATVPLWVPLTTAAAGLVAGLVAGLGAAVWTQQRTDRREDVRWERERGDRQDQWRREDSLRWLQDRQQAYAKLIAALYEWDVVLRSAIANRKNDAALNERTELDTAEMWRARRVARVALPLVEFMAPQTVRSRARSAVQDREAFWIVQLTGEFDSADTDAKWTRLAKGTSSLRKAMRDDLKFEDSQVDVTEQLLAEATAMLRQDRRWWRPWGARPKRISPPGANA